MLHSFKNWLYPGVALSKNFIFLKIDVYGDIFIDNPYVYKLQWQNATRWRVVIRTEIQEAFSRPSKNCILNNVWGCCTRLHQRHSRHRQSHFMPANCKHCLALIRFREPTIQHSRNCFAEIPDNQIPSFSPSNSGPNFILFPRGTLSTLTESVTKSN